VSATTPPTTSGLLFVVVCALASLTLMVVLWVTGVLP
jgi:hypothetical protein